MKICIPVTHDQGKESPVCDHFGSSPFFMIVDTGDLACRAIPNTNSHHGHGMCRPLEALGGEQIDGVVVRGIGMGALHKLVTAGLRVFLAEHPTVAQVVEAFKQGTLREMTPGMACGGHGGACGGHAG